MKKVVVKVAKEPNGQVRLNLRAWNGFKSWDDFQSVHTNQGRLR